LADPLRLLIVGGYGVAGKAVARAVASRLPGPLRLTLAGRDGGTANAAIAALATEMPEDADLRALELDATSWAALRAALASCDIVIWCAPLDEARARELVAALIETGTDCVDIAPNRAKHVVLRDAARGLGDAGFGYVIDAGADPGLPGWLAHHVASRHGAPDRVEIVARYRDRDIGPAGISKPPADR
jgi:saccharopine dehydrogenase-like NADP-dependent oxidoreductase